MLNASGRDRPEGQGRRIRLALYTDATTVGGAEISASRLIGALSPGTEVTVAGRDADVVAWIAGGRSGAGTYVVPLPRRRRDPGTLLAHVRMLERLRPDIVQLNMVTPWSCRYAILAGVVLRHRGLISVEHLPHPTSSRLHRWFKRLAERGIAAHVAVGERSAREVERFAGLPSGSVRTIYNGVPDRALVQVPRPSEGPVVGTLARLDQQKGLDVLIEALALLPDATALLVGDGAEREPLVRQAAAQGVDDRLVVTGWREDARDYLTAMDVFVLPSRFEGLPLSVPEAMLAGLPVVASDVGSVGEAVIDGETGCLVAPNDPHALAEAVRILLADPERGRAMGRRGRARALELFSLARMAESFEALYDEVL
jgi:glycosyltransferase involved in cell wall biosynthesis